MEPREPLPADIAAWLAPMLAGHGGLLAVFDHDDRLRWCNASFRQTMSVPPDAQDLSWSELMRHQHAAGQGTLIKAADFELWLASAASRRGKQPYRQFEADLHDGRWILMTETVDERGWMLCVGLDVSDLGRDHRALRMARDQAVRASQVDALTGIGNRASVLQRLAEALTPQAARPCAALVDLDHFKSINDRLGHAAGDAVLRDFARSLQAGLRRADACGRIGGEEFLVVLGEVDLDGAEEVVQRLLAQVRSCRPLPAHPCFGYTASVGLVQARAGERPEDLMARADAALYQAKHAGRDRCLSVA